MPRRSRHLKIPPWVPVEAQQAIENLWQDPSLDKTARAALIRLATDRRMEAAVWAKLPCKSEVIPLAIFALMIFPTLRPRPRTMRRRAWESYAQHLSDHPKGLDWRTCAVMAINLRDVLAAPIDEMWSRHWPGGSAISRTRAIEFLEYLANCFQSIGAETQSFLANLNLPPVARWDDPQAQQRFFSEFMSDKLKALCGRPHDPVVDALTAVVFDLRDGGPGEATVRGRRRMRAAK